VSYSVLIRRGAAHQLAALSSSAFVEVRDLIRSLATDPMPPEAKQIGGKDGWRVSAGHCRVIYELDARAGRLTVLDVGRRSDA